MNSRLLLALLADAQGSSFSAGCAQHGYPGPHPHAGPPPHAPAHGHRHSYGDGIELVIDSGLGLYVVSSRPHYYFQDGWYWRWQRSVPESSLSLVDRGAPAARDSVIHRPAWQRNVDITIDCPGPAGKVLVAAGAA